MPSFKSTHSSVPQSNSIDMSGDSTTGANEVSYFRSTRQTKVVDNQQQPNTNESDAAQSVATILSEGATDMPDWCKLLIESDPNCSYNAGFHALSALESMMSTYLRKEMESEGSYSSSATPPTSTSGSGRSTPTPPPVRGHHISSLISHKIKKTKHTNRLFKLSTFSSDVTKKIQLATTQNGLQGTFNAKVFQKINELQQSPHGCKPGFLYESQELCLVIPRLKYLRSVQFLQRCCHEDHKVEGETFDYSFNLDHNHDSVYTPQVVRSEIDEDGNLINSTRAGLCAYCEEPKFFNIKTSSYAQHLCLQHGILTQGKLLPFPIAYGKYYFHKPENVTSKKKRHTVAQYHFDDAVLCPMCLTPLGIGCTGKTKNRPLVNYLRHYRDSHGQSAEGKQALLEAVWEAHSEESETSNTTSR